MYNKFKKKELGKNNNLWLAQILNKMSKAKFSEEVAKILNGIMEQNGVETAKIIYHKALKRNPVLPKPSFSIKDGKFVEYSVNLSNFVSIDSFFENPEKYLYLSQKEKEKSLRRHLELEESKKIKSDFEYRYSKLDQHKTSIDLFFYKASEEKGFGKIVRDNRLISTVESGDIFFVMKSFLQDRLRTFAKYNVLKIEDAALFPMTVGYSLYGFKEAKHAYLVNDLYEIKNMMEDKGIDSQEKFEEFLKKYKFIVLNDVPTNIKIYPIGTYNEILKQEKKIIDFINKSPFTAIDKKYRRKDYNLEYFITDFSEELKFLKKINRSYTREKEEIAI